MPRKIKGVRRHGAGFQTFCRVNGEFRSETWPRDTPVSEMTTWLREQRASKTAATRTRGTFERDADLYLSKVEALPTYAQRKTHINLWVDVLRGRRRQKVTSAEIRGQRDTWLLQGLAPHTVNLRLRALSNLWTVLDGRRAPNPVREVPEAVEPQPEPKAIPYWLAQRLVSLIHGRLERAQAEAMLTIGLTPVELSRLEAKHWHDGHLFVQGRKKGAGGAARLIPLTPDANTALQQLDAVDGWQRLPSKQFYRLFRKVCERTARDPLVIETSLRLRVRTLSAYDLRHTYATELYRLSGDAHAAAQILGHRSKQTTARYIAAALQERMKMAVATLGRPVEHKLPEKVAKRGKR